MSLDIRPAAPLSLAERVELFNAGYEDYVVPMHIDEEGLGRMVETLDIDLDASRVAYRDGEPVGFANLAVRGNEAWVGGVGVVVTARRSGVGKALMEAIHEKARERGVERVWLEVITENTGAFALYEKLGYRTVQDVEVWTLPGADDEPPGREVPVAEARALIPSKHDPWQRADATLAHADDIRGWVTDSGAMLFAARQSAQLQQYTGDPEPLIRALRTFGNAFVLNLPANDPAAAVFRELGGTVAVRQHEMVLDL
ncbi:MAG TPA: GNAT family N-acetyltransferase [Gaiellaceae bacterium]|jgi:GNAT superfamily N-acetyltransferase